MNQQLTGWMLVFTLGLGGPPGLATEALQAGPPQTGAQPAGIDTRPLRVTIMGSPGKAFLPGGILRFMTQVRDPDGAPLEGPVTYLWSVPPTLSLAGALDREFLVVTGPETLGCAPGQSYLFTVTAKAGSQVGVATYAVSAVSRDASPVWLKVNILCDPANRTLKAGQPLVLKADLQPAGGGLSPALVTYAWSVSPALPSRLPNEPALNLSSAQTQAMKVGQAYVFTLKVRIGQGEVPANCTVNVVPAGAPVLLNRPKVPTPLLRPSEKPPIARP